MIRVYDPEKWSQAVRTHLFPIISRDSKMNISRKLGFRITWNQQTNSWLWMYDQGLCNNSLDMYEKIYIIHIHGGRVYCIHGVRVYCNFSPPPPPTSSGVKAGTYATSRCWIIWDKFQLTMTPLIVFFFSYYHAEYRSVSLSKHCAVNIYLINNN